MGWEVEGTEEFDGWFRDLEALDQARIEAAVEMLQDRGPTLGRPTVDSISGSTIHNLKELRPAGSAIRILFVFDPRRTAILLFGADKSEHGWNKWYPKAIAQAEGLYTEYLNDLREEGLIT
jgi:hypothetical protein